MNGKTKTSAVLILLLLSALTGASAQPAPATPLAMPPTSGRGMTLKEIDAMLVQLSSMSADLARFTARGPAGLPEAPGDAKITTRADYRKGQLQDCTAKPFTMADLPGRDLPDSTQVDLSGYYVCRAFTEKKPELCDGLSLLKFKTPDSQLAVSCRMQYQGLGVAQSGISRAPDAMAKCMERQAKSDPPGMIPQENLGKVCTIILGPDEPAAVCAKISPLMKTPLSAGELAECASKMARDKGDANACSKATGKQTIERCQDMAAYRKAQAAKDPKLCGGSTYCKVLMGNASACDFYLGKAKALYCSDATDKKDTQMGPLIQSREAELAKERKEHPVLSAEGRYMQLFQQKSADIEMLLKQVGGSIEAFQPKSTAEFKQRKDRFIARRASLQNQLKQFRSSHGGSKKTNGEHAEQTDDDAQ